jgi:ABC-type lipoprotein release transport system permease subunit
MRIVALVVRIAARSLIAHRVKSLLVGLLLATGTFLVVFFGALLGSVEDAMRGAITESFAGHLQVYSEDARDPLELFGGFGFGSADIGEIPDFAAVERALLDVPGVTAVLPMGITSATVFGRNEIDAVNGDLRDALRRGDEAAVGAWAARARRIVESMADESDTFDAIGDPAVVESAREALRRASDPSFWAPLDPGGDAAARQEAVDFLDSRIAPIARDGRLFYLRVIGTDIERFTAEFDRFYIVKGTGIPAGERGVLLSDRTYEMIVKNQVARQLDELREAIVDDGERIADDPLLQQAVRRMVDQYKRITFALSPADADVVAGLLRSYLGVEETSLEELVRRFLAVDDATVAERHAWFYEHVAPRVPLYDIPVGSEVPLRGFTRSGYLRSVSVKVWGTYEMRGLEKAGIEQASNLSDLTTFRELYGKMGAAQLAELDEIRREVGVAEVARDDAEAMLFGGAPVAVGGSAGDAAVPEPASSDLVLNAAVVLGPDSDLGAVTAAIDAASEANGLGLQVVDWKTAAGIFGQFISVVQLVVVVCLGITGLVTLVIVNNAVVMSTIDRVPEIGTIRAVGGQRGLVVALVLVETAMLAVLAGAAGAAAAVLAIQRLGIVGIPAVADALTVLFAGDRLYPVVRSGDVVLGLVAVAAVALVSTLYPATVAAAVPPVVAMRGKE